MPKYFNEIKRILKDLDYWEARLYKAFKTGNKKDIEKIAKIIKELLKKLHYFINIEFGTSRNQRIDQLSMSLYYWRRMYEEASRKGDVEEMLSALGQIRRIEKEIRRELERENGSEMEL